jgi:uncharacterized membrane protein (TIGR02234 family)
MAEPAPRKRSRSFAPTVLLGLAGATLAAVAGAKDWATASGSAAGLQVQAAAKGSVTAPLVTALALVALAAWGVVLVTRGRVRQVLAVVGGLASVGALVATAVAFGDAQHDAVAALVAKGATGHGFPSHLTGWAFAAGVGAVVAVAAFVVAVPKARGWPAMGTRYDAPGTRADAPVTEQDMWRAFDEGQDPTS